MNLAEWRFFDDRNVSVAMDHRIVSKYAYVLYYQRRPVDGSPGAGESYNGEVASHVAVPEAVASEEVFRVPPEEKKPSLEDVDENELD